jgi:ankyrin repeat protein
LQASVFLPQNIKPMATNPLHTAIKRADLVAINALLKQPAAILALQINEYDYSRKTPLMQAVKNHHVPVHIVRQLIDYGANLHQETKRFGTHRSIMSLAIRAHDVQKVELLIQAGATLNYLRGGEYGPLLDAVQTSDVATNPQLLNILQLLIDHHVELNIITKYHESALRVLSRVGRFDAVALLLHAGADDSQLKWSALAQAVALGNIDDMKRCVENGCDLEDRDWWSRTPYLIAIQTGDIEKAKLLLSAGANPNATGRCGQQPLTYAISNFHTPMLRWLVASGSDIALTCDFDTTYLMHAVQSDNAEAVVTLLQAGAQLNTRSQTSANDSGIPDVAALVRDVVGDTALADDMSDMFSQLKEMAVADAPSNPLKSLLPVAGAVVEHSVLSDVRSAKVAKLLLDAGADPKYLTHSGQRLLIGYSANSDLAMLDNSSEQFFAARERVFGSQNPERMHRPFWLAMIRAGISSSTATEYFNGPSSYDHTPVWCAERFGQSITFLNDGRIVQIGGEHEDDYDPDFCIYNDVFVHEPKSANGAVGSVALYGYPEATFPPTDFHTATLMNDSIIVIGGLGYAGTRVSGETRVFKLDIETFAFTQVITTGNAPGWIFKHRTEKISDDELRVRGGTVVTGKGNDESHDDNLREFVLDLRNGVWRLGVG